MDMGSGEDNGHPYISGDHPKTNGLPIHILGGDGDGGDTDMWGDCARTLLDSMKPWYSVEIEILDVEDHGKGFVRMLLSWISTIPTPVQGRSCVAQDIANGGIGTSDLRVTFANGPHYLLERRITESVITTGIHLSPTCAKTVFGALHGGAGRGRRDDSCLPTIFV
jgi:hypothetical protein